MIEWDVDVQPGNSCINFPITLAGLFWRKSGSTNTHGRSGPLNQTTSGQSSRFSFVTQATRSTTLISVSRLQPPVNLLESFVDNMRAHEANRAAGKCRQDRLADVDGDARDTPLFARGGDPSHNAPESIE